MRKDSTIIIAFTAPITAAVVGGAHNTSVIQPAGSKTDTQPDWITLQPNTATTCENVSNASRPWNLDNASNNPNTCLNVPAGTSPVRIDTLNICIVEFLEKPTVGDAISWSDLDVENEFDEGVLV